MLNGNRSSLIPEHDQDSASDITIEKFFIYCLALICGTIIVCAGLSAWVISWFV